MDDKWSKLNLQIKTVNPSFEDPILPFSTKTVLKDYNEVYARVTDKKRLAESQ